jgi:thiaminase
MPKAIPVLDENIEFIQDYAKERGFNLDYIQDTKEYYAEYGYVTYLITDGSNETRNLTFTEMTGADFERIWKFTSNEDPRQFVEIAPV